MLKQRQSIKPILLYWTGRPHEPASGTALFVFFIVSSVLKVKSCPPSFHLKGEFTFNLLNGTPGPDQGPPFRGNSPFVVDTQNNADTHTQRQRTRQRGESEDKCVCWCVSQVTLSISPHMLKIMPSRFMQSGVGSSSVGLLSVLGGLYLQTPPTQNVTAFHFLDKISCFTTEQHGHSYTVMCCYLASAALVMLDDEVQQTVTDHVPKMLDGVEDQEEIRRALKLKYYKSVHIVLATHC